MRIVIVGPATHAEEAASLLSAAGLSVDAILHVTETEGDGAAALCFEDDGSLLVFLGVGNATGGVKVSMGDLADYVRSAAANADDRHPGSGVLASSRAAELEEHVERLVARLAQSEERLQEAKRRHRMLARRRSVRLALKVANTLRPLLLAVRVVRAGLDGLFERRRRSSSARRRATTREEVIRGLEATRSELHPVDGPLVSIVVPTRNGAGHLRVLLPALATTAYRSFELIVVDNASDDDTADVLAADWPFPLSVLRNERNASFSHSNNRAAETAEGDLLLFLNNDVEPITTQWLGAMVAALQDRERRAAAVGALLVYPDTGDPSRDFTVQHRGTRFGFRGSAPHASNMAADDPTDPALAGIHEVPAVSAAALMVRRDTFERVGGFSLGYVYGAEDVDLCLRLREQGTVVLQGDAVLFHHESATQAQQSSPSVDAQRSLNWELYAETWGPRISRSVRRDRFLGTGRWTGQASPPIVAITLTHDDPAKGYGDYFTAHELGDALAVRGFEIHYAERYRDAWEDLPADVSVVIGLLDSFDARLVASDVVKVAWVRNWVERWLERPWFGSYDVVVAGSESAAAAIRRASRFDPPVLPLASNPDRFLPGEAVDSLVADYVFTGNYWGVDRSLTSMLEVRDGERFAIYGKGWDGDRAMKEHWRGQMPYERLPDAYRSAKVVLDDTAGPTIDHGFVNSRVFDALACGALVLTDNRRGSDEVFDGRLPVYGDAESLRVQLDRYLVDDAARDALAGSLRDIVVTEHTYARRAEQFEGLTRHLIESPLLAVKIGAPEAQSAYHWGDFHFANSLIRAMAPHGFHGRVHLLPEWDLPNRQSADVVVHLRGLSRYRPKPSAVNVLWVISHPDDVTEAEADAFDLVCVASPVLAERFHGRIDAPVVLLPQATDALKFGSGRMREDLASDVLFVGNTRNQRRPAVEWAAAAGLPLSVYGLGWDKVIPRSMWRDEYFANENLADLYASAGLVLNDHWPDMRDHGVVSNRIFDVLAAGGVVVSDPVAGLDDLLDGFVPVYRDGAELADLATRLLEDPDERARLAEGGRRAVLEAHTFDHRAARLVELVGALLEGRPTDCDGNVFRIPLSAG